MRTIRFELDGAPVEAACYEDDTLLDVLRERLGVTSAKNGCGTGACGACTVLVNGRVRRACTLDPGRVEGKAVTTVDGLAQPQALMVAACLAHGGAVQCGFCTPGMVVSATTLLVRNPEPTPAQVRKALRGNLCRCTGYARIVDGVLEAARRLRERKGPPPPPPGGGIGRPACREGDLRRALGTHPFVDDVRLPGMLFGAVVLAGKARATLRSLDTAPARRVAGVVRVITARDVPGERHHGMIHRDWPIYVARGEEVRYVGDVLALVVAESRAAARAGAAALTADLEELPPLTAPDEALADGAPRLHPGGNLLSNPTVRRGDLAAARAAAAHVAEDTFHTPAIEHAFLEPESALAIPASWDGPLPEPFPADARGTLTVLSGTQGVFSDRKQIAPILDLPDEQVRVVLVPPGGGFGGKEDLSVQHHAALAAWLCDQPVNVTLSRAESILVHPKRHAMTVRMAVGCDAAGALTFCDADVVSDTGAYASLGGEVTERATVHAAGPYEFAAVQLVGRCVYTNNPPAGAMRGFGVPQVAFALEALLDRLADAAELDRLDLRALNALRPGRRFATGQVMEDDIRFEATLDAVRDVYQGALDAGRHVGLACAIKNVGIGVGVPDIGRVRAEVRGGRVVLFTGAACMGQGLEQVLRNIAAETLELQPDLIDVVMGDTAITPDSGVTTASRLTYLAGAACLLACQKLAAAAKSDLASLEGQAFAAEFGPRTQGITDPAEPPRSHVAFGFASQVAVLDDEGRVERLVMALDGGQVINPLGVQGQAEGGVAMGLGYALTEGLVYEAGVPTVTDMARLGLPRATDVPDIEVILLPGAPAGSGASGSPLGAKGIGEVTAIPTAPAVAAAHRMRTGEALTRLPLELEPKKGTTR
jgi:selenium-dependent xanthine dehydrogenase